MTTIEAIEVVKTTLGVKSNYALSQAIWNKYLFMLSESTLSRYKSDNRNMNQKTAKFFKEKFNITVDIIYTPKGYIRR